MANNRGSSEPSEFGGDPGMVQPRVKGHEYSGSEELTALYAVDPMDSESVPDPALNGKKRVQ